MLDAKTQKALSKKVGTETNQGSTLIAMMGIKAPEVNNEFRELLQQRNLPDVTIQDMTIDTTTFLVITKTIQKNEKTATAIRIEPYGNDLLVDIRHFERSVKADNKRVMWGSLLFAIGLFTFWTGVGLLALIVGAWLAWFAKSRFPEGSAEHQTSRQHYEMVLETVITSLENCEINAKAQFYLQFNI